jgi:hypothetical protein
MLVLVVLLVVLVVAVVTISGLPQFIPRAHSEMVELGKHQRRAG